ncbi:MAG TPA: chemotaxis protein CheZ [Rhodospirillales bacterium]|nr:chemotaxis protein CheZ [Rhodospirillales bacterium]
MPGDKIGSALGHQLDELRDRHGDTIKVSEISGVVESLLSTVRNELEAADKELFGELEALAQYIQTAKTEIAALCPDEVNKQFLPTAGDELDAIIEATAEATNAIMDATEIVEGVLDGLDGPAKEKLMEATTKIYEACGFQDITGQRITRIVQALKEIENKVGALVEAFGNEIKKHEALQPDKDEEKGGRPIDDADLLNGPQSKKNAKSQDEIDALLASFD